jgi:hypothetical protein
MKATLPPSGENPAEAAPLVPGSSLASARSSRRMNSRRTPFLAPSITTV